MTTQENHTVTAIAKGNLDPMAAVGIAGIKLRDAATELYEVADILGALGDEKGAFAIEKICLSIVDRFTINDDGQPLAYTDV